MSWEPDGLDVWGEAVGVVSDVELPVEVVEAELARRAGARRVGFGAGVEVV